MIREILPEGKGFTKAYISEGWQICFVSRAEQYGELSVMKRHHDTDEGFVLLSGVATLYTLEDGEVREIPMVCGRLYMIQRGTWHHLHIQDDNTLLIAVESDAVRTENTERMEIDS